MKRYEKNSRLTTIAVTGVIAGVVAGVIAVKCIKKHKLNQVKPDASLALSDMTDAEVKDVLNGMNEQEFYEFLELVRDKRVKRRLVILANDMDVEIHKLGE